MKDFRDREETTRVSTSTKLPGMNKVTPPPPPVTLLADNWELMKKALTRIVDSMGEQNEQISIRMSEIESSSY